MQHHVFFHRPIQMLRVAIDLKAWQGKIPYIGYRIMGRLVRSLVTTVSVVIFKIWMSLISFWTSKSTDRLCCHNLIHVMKT